MGEKGKDYLTLATNDDLVQLGQETNVQTLVIEPLHEEAEFCVPGDQVGQAWFDKTNAGHPEKFRVSVDFDFDAHDGQVSARGVAKSENGKLKGKLPATGSGKFRDWHGQVQLDECNPKRWIFEPGLPGI